MKNKNKSKIGNSFNFFNFEAEKSKEENNMKSAPLNDFKKQSQEFIQVEIVNPNKQQSDDKQTRKVIVFLCYLSSLFSIFCFYKCVDLKGILSFGYFVFGLPIQILSIKYSFVAYQLKYGKLCTVRDWFKNKKEWFPKF